MTRVPGPRGPVDFDFFRGGRSAVRVVGVDGLDLGVPRRGLFGVVVVLGAGDVTSLAFEVLVSLSGILGFDAFDGAASTPGSLDEPHPMFV